MSTNKDFCILFQFYHACKGDVITLFCLFPYDTMGFMDYICSLLSFWVTLIAMSKIPERSKYFFYILGTLGIVFEAKYATHGLATFMVPFVLGVVIMLGSWVSCATDTSYNKTLYFLEEPVFGITSQSSELHVCNNFYNPVKY